MIWNILFKIYRNNELFEEGFETSMAHDLNHALQEVDSMFDLEDADKIELQINTIELEVINDKKALKKEKQDTPEHPSIAPRP